MKKSLIIITLAILANIQSFAQSNIFNNPDNKAYFGLRIGGDITCPGKVSAQNIGIKFFNSGGGIEFGGIYNLPVFANFYIEPGVKFFYNTYSIKKEFIYLIQDDIIFDGASIRKFGVRIPIMAGYHFDLTDKVKVFAFTGPEFEIGLSAKERDTGHNIEMTENSYGDNGILNRFNFLWGFGAGVSYQQFYLGVNGGVGLVNMLKNSDMKFHENRVTFSLGYNF